MSTKPSVYKNASRKEYKLTNEQRNIYRKISQESREAKRRASLGFLSSIHSINTPRLEPNQLMPPLESNGLTTLSLFSGGGGLDLGFDKAGYTHQGAYELIPICGKTLKSNRPNWIVHSGPENGDVSKVVWQDYIIDVIHGGPPCQPFSIAGQQAGQNDDRNMWGEFIRAVNAHRPKSFVAENVLGILNPKFSGFVQKYILDKLPDYHIHIFELNAADFGVPQQRRRVFFVGFRTKAAFKCFQIPKPSHRWKKSPDDLFEDTLAKTMGVREALGLADTGYDALAPTLRSAFTGKRNTTSVLNSSAGQKAWGNLGIWPNGVQANREKASAFPAKYDHFRLSVQDCALLQGFPEYWRFAGAVYQVLGQIGNSVAPPVAYQVAKAVAFALAGKQHHL
ncbi:DNA methyltransferase [Candidatus Thiomargarita nelsonii]|uniref:Cytosine-specific methyltransferase n=1 Tax=Candidatus Thiomargarita nelsonii TaxID=1003181 RepID=A0A0A6P5Q9_9GAMM|nr:DNA methyltransferase [Candidatus Thiomargarita nelsonii]